MLIAFPGLGFHYCGNAREHAMLGSVLANVNKTLSRVR